MASSNYALLPLVKAQVDLGEVAVRIMCRYQRTIAWLVAKARAIGEGSQKFTVTLLERQNDDGIDNERTGSGDTAPCGRVNSTAFGRVKAELEIWDSGY